jgi:hypothetical protein
MLEKRERQIAAPPSGNSGFHVVPAAGARNDQHIVITSASVGASFRFSLITLCVHPKPSLRDPLPTTQYYGFCFRWQRVVAVCLSSNWELSSNSQERMVINFCALRVKCRQVAAPPSGNSGFHVVPAAGARNDQHIVITSASVGASFRFSLITLCVHPKIVAARPFATTQYYGFCFRWQRVAAVCP